MDAVMPVFMFLTVTAAFGTKPPDGSRTIPLIVPRSTCACTASRNNVDSKTQPKIRIRVDTLRGHPWLSRLRVRPPGQHQAAVHRTFTAQFKAVADIGRPSRIGRAVSASKLVAENPAAALKIRCYFPAGPFTGNCAVTV